MVSLMEDKEMTYTAPDHYSYKYKFNIEKLPAMQVDCISTKLTMCGIICGMLFVLLGAFELLSYALDLSNEDYNFDTNARIVSTDLFVLRYAFDVFILCFGIVIVFISAAARKRKKIISFDGEKFKITHNFLLRKPKEECEDLYNYLGVLLRVEYYQLGLMSRNRYIIELYHRDKNKRVPLYIATGGGKIREIWEYYAEKLKMPALFMTDRGLVSRHYLELKKTLREMSKRWRIDTFYKEEEHAPSSVKYIAKPDKVILKERRCFFDVYSVLSVAAAGLWALLTLAAGMYWSRLSAVMGWGLYTVLMVISVLLLLSAVIAIFCKDVLIINGKEIILGHNILFLRMDFQALPKDEIESVDIGHNPITDRYYLAIISHHQSMIYGKNMPINDLRWIRGCVIREIVKTKK